jgi:hypothetical protein
MASPVALAAVEKSKCARDRLGNRDLREAFEAHGLNATLAALCCGGFACTHRVHTPGVVAAAPGRKCRECVHSERSWLRLLLWWELMSEPVFWCDHQMLMSPHLFDKVILRCNDKHWEEYRTSRLVRGDLPQGFLRNLQPARVLLMEGDASEYVSVNVACYQRPS